MGRRATALLPPASITGAGNSSALNGPKCTLRSPMTAKCFASQLPSKMAAVLPSTSTGLLVTKE